MEEEAATTRRSLLLKQKHDNNDQWSSSDHGDSFFLISVFTYGAQYSIFGSILTIGAMLGAVFSGKFADFIGRKGVSYFML
ncbi:sugar transporter erd6-like 3 [Quercus suber]|uniref:Sugar transporter erd6-like 3 n=1 Tax=Quercus suber TaxID=58331 RepID=A0AAW0JLE4_QUESU